MEWFKEIFNQISSLFKWWAIVQPWESGLRIRLGKKIKVLNNGIHFRIPYLDTVYIQPIRLTFINTSPQTITTTGGECITISMIIGYTIKDILKLYNAVSELESVVSSKVMGEICRYVVTKSIKECNPDAIETHVKSKINSEDFGLEIKDISITSYALVKTYRLIQDSNWMDTRHKLDDKK